MLSDLSVINTPPQLKQIPEFELLLNVDKTFVSKFISGKGHYQTQNHLRLFPEINQK